MGLAFQRSTACVRYDKGFDRESQVVLYLDDSVLRR